MPDLTLRRECELFHRYLIGGDPADYVLEKYVAAHAVGNHGPVSKAAPEDALIRFARLGAPFVHLADAYAAVFQRGGALRRKLILLVAILESYGPTSPRVDAPDGRSAAGFWGRAALQALGFAVTLAVSVIVFVPFRALGGGRRE